MNFLEGGPKIDLLESVLAGEDQFGLHGADALITACAQNKPLSAIAAIYRRNPTVLTTLKRSGINGPEGFAGKTIQVGSGSGNLVLHAMTTKVGISLELESITTSIPLIKTGEDQIG